MLGETRALLDLWPRALCSEHNAFGRRRIMGFTRWLGHRSSVMIKWGYYMGSLANSLVVQSEVQCARL